MIITSRDILIKAIISKNQFYSSILFQIIELLILKLIFFHLILVNKETVPLEINLALNSLRKKLQSI